MSGSQYATAAIEPGQGAGRTERRPPASSARGSGGSGEPETITVALVGKGDPVTVVGSGGIGEGWTRSMTSS
jgi:hypothetical protein